MCISQYTNPGFPFGRVKKSLIETSRLDTGADCFILWQSRRMRESAKYLVIATMNFSKTFRYALDTHLNFLVWKNHWYRPLVIFSHSQISKNSQSKHCTFKSFPSKLNSTFTLSPVVVIISTRLAVILNFPYLCVVKFLDH